jgi:protein involved in polysaccharide export with SLBB domain
MAMGSVFEQAAFLHDGDLHVGDYLKKAGGPTRSADKSHMFIIRADGSVVAKSANSGLFARNFDTLPLHPGDTVVVPTYINKTTFVRGLMDWTQIFSNLALGAAAINVLQ